MFNSMRTGVISSLAQRNHTGANYREHLNFKHAFYLATKGGAVALNLGEEIGMLKSGFRFDAVVLDGGIDNIDIFPNEAPESLFEKLCTLADDRNVRWVFVQGKKLKSPQS
mmetsp:Transcript_12689/g.14793  ORF Transcript_12689/g.14793 Transcript_12689/m.14793 type:complete len:111 (+) Transcript_12689:308-640(+)